MKVMLEISNKFIEIAKGVILGAVNDEKDEQKVINHNKEQKKCRKCGQCGYYMAYCKSDGSKDHYGDCASIGMNNECNEGNNHFKDPDEELLQVDSNEDACGFFKAKQTSRVKKYIKEHPDIYYQDTHFKPKPVR